MPKKNTHTKIDDDNADINNNNHKNLYTKVAERTRIYLSIYLMYISLR